MGNVYVNILRSNSLFKRERERDHWGDVGVDGWIILGWISRR
jgi:hypothetical protein